VIVDTMDKPASLVLSARIRIPHIRLNNRKLPNQAILRIPHGLNMEEWVVAAVKNRGFMLGRVKFNK
jgi:hypothetical protein